MKLKVRFTGQDRNVFFLRFEKSVQESGGYFEKRDVQRNVGTLGTKWKLEGVILARGGGGVCWHQNNRRSASDQSPVPKMIDEFRRMTYYLVFSLNKSYLLI